MVRRQQAKAAGTDAARRVRRAANQSKQRATEALQSSRVAPQLDATTQAVEAGLGRVGRLSSSWLTRVGGTRPGEALARGTRATGTQVRKLPIVSAAFDVAAQRNGVVELRERLNDDPADAMAHVHLAEALRRTERDLYVLLAGRAIINPGSLVVRQALRAAAGLDQAATEPPARQLLRRAFTLAKHRLRADPDDAEALHVAARVYLAEGHARHAVRFSRRAAIAAPPAAGPALITLGRAYLEVGDKDAASRAATMAIQRGMTVGHEILIAADDTATGWRERAVIDAERSACVEAEDRRLYNGVAYTPSDVTRAVVATQGEKTREAATALAEFASRVRRGTRTRE